MITLVLRKVDGWLFAEYYASVHDLAVTRMLLAAYLLTQLPVGRWISDLPRVFYDPPISIALFSNGFANELLVGGLNVVAVLAATCLLLGYHARVASIATTGALVVLNTLIYATGKIDHDILLVVAPAIMAWSGWADAWSIDASLNKVTHLDPDRRRPTWQLAWMALLVSLTLATAAAAKAHSGWLHLTESSAYGHALANAMLNGRETWIGTALLSTESTQLWELADWATVGVESAGLIAVWRSRWFRAWCTILAAFHLSVALHMDIWFASNLVAYALFVP